ncbi:hypothetical protein DXG03_006376 [Asterophora parasitica]|uniref:Uncharacterized protein n=1 Tax=Asterophora parasitica TaxID=117018 RepID=A0A9P7G195_9AGAR|nr:hypothetical protein DXG03_006376 [Asterophora parasitica]
MAKKEKDQAPNATSVANRDIIQRLNFLYQASVYLSSLPSTTSRPIPSSGCESTSANATIDPGKTKRSVRGKKERNVKAAKRTVTARYLARTYIGTMKVVGQKTTVKIVGTRQKYLQFIAFSLANVDQLSTESPAHGHTMVYTCMGCNTSRRIPAPPVLSTGQGLAASQNVMSSDPASGPFETPSTVVEDITMDVERPAATSTGKPHKRGKRKVVQSRVPPLFARDVGHVVFCGNDKVVTEEGLGDGLFIT